MASKHSTYLPTWKLKQNVLVDPRQWWLGFLEIGKKFPSVDMNTVAWFSLQKPPPTFAPQDFRDAYLEKALHHDRRREGIVSFGTNLRRLKASDSNLQG